MFYVGKGTGKRAWIHGRDALWQRFVETRLNGAFVIAIVQDGLTEGAALELEDRLIAHYGDQLVNRVNMGRGLNLAALDLQRELWRQRDAAEARARASQDPRERASLFEEALALHSQADAIVTEAGIVGELLAEMPIGRIALIEGYVRALIAAGDAATARLALDEYVAHYPAHRTHGKVAFLERALARVLRRPGRTKSC